MLGRAVQVNATPMQPRGSTMEELDKLEVTVAQVLNALSTESYTKDFGEALLQKPTRLARC